MHLLCERPLKRVGHFKCPGMIHLNRFSCSPDKHNEIPAEKQRLSECPQQNLERVRRRELQRLTEHRAADKTMNKHPKFMEKKILYSTAFFKERHWKALSALQYTPGNGSINSTRGDEPRRM